MARKIIGIKIFYYLIKNILHNKIHFKIKRPKNIFKMNKEVRMLLPKKDLIQVE